MRDAAGRGSDTVAALWRRPLTLIHTNNSPNPVSMRVSSRLTIENLDSAAFLSWQVFMGGPLGHLLLKRRADAK